MAQKLAAGNWKMNGTSEALSEIEALLPAAENAGCDVLICPPATLIDRMRRVVGTGALKLGGQDCHVDASGAHTGDLSAGMLADAGATYVIVGHSERRQDHGETDATVRAKAQAALGSGLVAVVCVGETEAERDDGTTLEVIGTQLTGSIPDGVTGTTLVVAYEPVWAIGTGRTPTVEQIAEVHDFIRSRLSDRFGGSAADGISLLYGGSVKPGNADEIFAVSNVDGALVGGASLKAADFSCIIKALDAQA